MWGNSLHIKGNNMWSVNFLNFFFFPKKYYSL